MPSQLTKPVPAALFFLYENLQCFIEWQEEHRTDYIPGAIVEAKDYCEFLKHQRTNEAFADFERDKAWKQNQNPATKCGHALHPSDTVVDGYCPVYEADMCLMFLDAIAKVFQKCGGPWQQARTLREYPLVRRCWHSARCELTRIVRLLEISTEYEEMWEKKYATDVGRIWTTNSATKAIRKAEMQHKYPAVVIEHSLLPRLDVKRKLSKLDEARIKVAKSCKSKHVTFTADTFDLPQRDTSEFCRRPSKAQMYQPGRHAAPLGLEWIDTSRVSNPIVNQNQKVYVTNSRAEFDALAEDSALRPPIRYQGILDLHPGVAPMSKFINQFLDGTATSRTDMLELIM